jgi:hypothetical protein
VLVVGNEHLPPKYILGLAYRHATGADLTPEQFSAGNESNGVLTPLGFNVRLKRDARLQWTSGGARRWNGKSLSSGQLAKIYGFTDLDGSQPDAWRYVTEVQDAGKPADVTGYR